MLVNNFFISVSITPNNEVLRVAYNSDYLVNHDISPVRNINNDKWDFSYLINHHNSAHNISDINQQLTKIFHHPSQDDEMINYIEELDIIRLLIK